MPYRNTPPITIFVAEDDTYDDNNTYVQRSVEYVLPDSKETQGHVTRKIIVKPSGSFLWVRLAVETLEHNWHTEDDIRRSLTELLQEMENL